MSADERARNLGAAAEGLRALADALDAGGGPLRNRGLRRVGGAPVVPAAVHDALCGFRVATPQSVEPPTMHCAGCGMAYLVEDALTMRDPRPARSGGSHGSTAPASDGARS